MAQVVIRGESVYECDVCKRTIRVQTNRAGLDTMQRCNITSGCQGKLHRVTSLKEINATPAFPPEVEGLRDWFPRNIFYVHTQPVRTAKWTLVHNLQNIPSLHTFVYRVVNGETVLVSHEPTTITTVDANTTIIEFAGAESGQVHCVSASSKNTVNFNATQTTVVPVSSIPLTSTSGELTIATLNSDPLIDLTIVYALTQPVSVDYTGIDSVPSTGSPWVGTSHVIVNGRKYTVRSFNLTTSPLAPAYFSVGLIPNGASFYVDKLNGGPINTNDVVFLMSGTPHSVVDRIYDRYVDSRSVTPNAPELFYSDGNGYTSSSIVKKTYPLILVV